MTIYKKIYKNPVCFGTVVKISYEKKDGIFFFENLLTIIIFLLQKTTVFLGGVQYSPFLKKAIYGKEKKYTRIPFLKPLLTKKLNIVNY